jgi:hypothetical protein
MPRPGQDARQDVATKLVETERMRGRRPARRSARLLRGWIDLREERTDKSRRDPNQHDDRADTSSMGLLVPDARIEEAVAPHP